MKKDKKTKKKIFIFTFVIALLLLSVITFATSPANEGEEGTQGEQGEQRVEAAQGEQSDEAAQGEKGSQALQGVETRAGAIAGEKYTNTAVGGKFYFDLSYLASTFQGENSFGPPVPFINPYMPDMTMHYVPFLYVGTIEGYNLSGEADVDLTTNIKNIFFAEHNVVIWQIGKVYLDLGLIYGQDYEDSKYTIRFPSGGEADSSGGVTAERSQNEWDAILNKDRGLIKNYASPDYAVHTHTLTQDLVEGFQKYTVRALDGKIDSIAATSPYALGSADGFRPVLEVDESAAGAEATEYLKPVELDLNEGALGTENVIYVVATGETYYAPPREGLSRPVGDEAGTYFSWNTKRDGTGTEYLPGETVSRNVDLLYAQWKEPVIPDVVITYDGNGGSGDMPTVTMKAGAVLTLPENIFMAPEGTAFKEWQIEGVPYAPGTSYTVEKNIVVTAIWETMDVYYEIEVNKVGQGSITPDGGESGIVKAKQGENVVFKISANKGYKIADVLINGVSVGAVNIYEFENIGASHTIEVIFAVEGEEDEKPPTGENRSLLIYITLLITSILAITFSLKYRKYQ